jgi:Transposase DDE domain group 1
VASLKKPPSSREGITDSIGNHHIVRQSLAKNRRLLRILGGELHQAQQLFAQTKQPTRVFKDFAYRTHKSWSRERRVVGKAEHLAKGPNPRFVVTSLAATAFPDRLLYEQEYCGRGDMENRIKEKQLMLFACRTSCATMRANQLRLYFSTVAYILLRALREFGLKQTALACAQCDTLRVKLLKIGAVVRVSVRRVYLALSEAYPFREVFTRAWETSGD